MIPPKTSTVCIPLALGRSIVAAAVRHRASRQTRHPVMQTLRDGHGISCPTSLATVRIGFSQTINLTPLPVWEDVPRSTYENPAALPEIAFVGNLR